MILSRLDIVFFLLFKGETLSSNNDGNQKEDSFRNLNRKKKSFDERDRVNLAKPFDLNEKKQKREGQEQK